MLGLRNEDISPIQQEIEADFAQLSVSYQQNLVQYEQALIDAIQRKFPLSQQTGQDLKGLQESLKLSNEDVAHISEPMLVQAELKHQNILKQKALQHQKDQEKAEYTNKLRRYEHEYTSSNSHYEDFVLI